MPFGMHKGLLMKEVPNGYLEWILSTKGMESDYPRVFLYAKKHCRDYLGRLSATDIYGK